MITHQAFFILKAHQTLVVMVEDRKKPGFSGLHLLRVDGRDIEDLTPKDQPTTVELKIIPAKLLRDRKRKELNHD